MALMNWRNSEYDQDSSSISRLWSGDGETTATILHKEVTNTGSYFMVNQGDFFASQGLTIESLYSPVMEDKKQWILFENLAITDISGIHKLIKIMDGGKLYFKKCLGISKGFCSPLLIEGLEYVEYNPTLVGMKSGSINMELNMTSGEYRNISDITNSYLNDINSGKMSRVHALLEFQSMLIDQGHDEAAQVQL